MSAALCQHSLHRQTLLLIGSHAVPPPFRTVFPHLYTLLTVSLVLCLTSRLTFLQVILAGLLSMPLILLPSLLCVMNLLLTYKSRCCPHRRPYLYNDKFQKDLSTKYLRVCLFCLQPISS